MDRRRIWGWWSYDWASQPYATLLLTFLFAPYFTVVAVQQFTDAGVPAQEAVQKAQGLWGTGLGITGLLIAVAAPILGAIADQTGRRLPWVWAFSLAYVVGATGLWWLVPTADAPVHLILALFGLGVIGMEFTAIFTNAMLPGLAPRSEIGRVSGTGSALGYVAGVLALVIMLAFFINDDGKHTLFGLVPVFGFDTTAQEGVRFTGPFTALWYVVFMVPFFLWVHEAPGAGSGRGVDLRAAMADLWRLIRSLRQRRSLGAWLLSSMLARDALNGLYSFGGIYAALVLQWPPMWVGVFGIVSAVAAALITWAGGHADRRFGPKPVVIAAIVVLTIVCLVVMGMDRASLFGAPLAEGSRLPDRVFLGCGILIGGAGGVLQAAGRTMMVRHTTPERGAEAFGLYALSGKATAFLAPLSVALVGNLTGSFRAGISPLIVMFVGSLALLAWVRAEGEA